MRRLLHGVGLIMIALTFSACSGCGEEENKCDGVTCERGVCSPDSGRCINAKDCGGEDDQCIAGYTCTAANTCQAQYPCTGTGQGSCASGQCVAGACIDKPTCEADADCAPGNLCGEDKTCKQDPCASGEVTCARGVCQRGTGMCVNEVVCTSENEGTACLEGYKCSQQRCINEQEFCSQQTCARGVCDFATLGCADAASCDGDDMRCLQGNFCNAQNTCEQNRCDANMTMCARGICQQTTGQCVNPASCTASSSCLDGNLCVGTRCVEQDKACGESGCEGNQVCAYDAGSRTAACDEDRAAGCSSALDCLGERICQGGQCADPTPCQPDTFEPNDDTASATSYMMAAQGGVVSGATLCAGDTDYFTFNTRQDPQQLGRLIVELSLAPADLGLGTLELELLDKNGASLSKATTDAAGRVRLEADVTVITQGDFVAVIRGQGVRQAGARYTLFMDVVDTTVFAACQAPRQLASGVAVENRNTNSGASSLLRSTCADGAGQQTEDIYALTVATNSYVTVKVTPAAEADVSVSLRSECLRDSSELAGACSERGGAGAEETLGAVLAPGTYFVVVQGPAPMTGGFYSIVADVTAVTCSSANNSCKDANTARLCNDRGTDFVEEACDTGCNAATGRCNRPLGDVCAEPITVSAQGYTGMINWSQMRADYDAGTMGCVPGAANATDGPDVAFKIDVPPDHAVEAVLQDRGSNVSLYLVTSCGDVGNTCLQGVNASQLSDERLFWLNPNPTTTTVYLIADTAQAMSYEQSSITITVPMVICAPGQAYCTTDAGGQPASHVCNAGGTGYENLTACPFGCDMATGLCAAPTNDTCDGALALTTGVPVMGTIGDYTSDYPLSSSACTGFTTTGRDAIYKLTLNAGDIVDLSLNSTFDAALWVSDTCDAMSKQIGQCIAGTDDVTSNATEELRFVAQAAGDYFVVAQAYSSAGMGTFTLTATVQAPQCMRGQPATCKDATTLEYCDGIGLLKDYTCTGGCNAGACATPTGSICADAKTLTGPMGTLAGETWANAGNSLEVNGSRVGGCFQDDFHVSAGPERFYRIDLNAGDLLSISLTTTNTTAYFYLFEDCDVLNTCVANNPLRGPGTLTYYARAAGPVFAVVDTASTSTATYGLSWTITQGATCAPNTSYCVDANTVARCDGTGAGTIFQTTCANGCEFGGCRPNVATQDTCAAAQAATDVGAGMTAYHVYSQHTSDVSMATPNCTGRATPGPDAFYKVTLQPGEVLHAVATSYGIEDPVVYAFKDCMDPAGTCVAGAGPVSNRAELYYLNQTMAAETLIVAVDSTLASHDEPVILLIEKLSPQCQPGSTQCAPNGTTLQLCNSFGLYDSFPCNGACTGAACDMPSGDACFDAFVLTGTSGQATGALNAGTNRFELPSGQTAGCFMDDFSRNVGRDTFYRVSLQAGDVFTASLSSTSTSTYMFFAQSCANLATSCLKSRVPLDSRAMTYRAEQAMDLIVIVDSTSTTNTATYTLNWRVDSGLACAPNSSRCVDATTVGLCSGDGLLEVTSVCSSGCSAGACLPDTTQSDSCAAAQLAPDVGAGIAVYANYSQFTNEINLPSTSCVGETTAGPDMFHKVTLQPGEILRARVESYGQEFPSVYAFTDCADAAGTCVAGGRRVGSGAYNASLLYANTGMAPETLIVAADNNFSTADETFGLFIEKLAPECQPGSRLCAADGATLQLCNALGLYDRFACNGTCTGQACDTPSGDACFDAFVLTGTSGRQTGTLSTGTNALQYPAGRAGGCIFDSFYGTAGRDTFYTINLQAGDVFTATLTTSSTSAHLMLLDGCVGNDACLTNIVSHQSGTVSYHAQQPMTLTMVVDSTSTTNSSTFTIDWRVESGRVCAPGQARCIDGMTLGLCSRDGSAEVQQTCANGCDVNGCTIDVTTMDTCAAALAATDIGAGVSIYAEYDDFTSEFNLSATSCVGQTTPGPDSMYKVELQPGEILYARAESADNDFPSLYVITDCTDAEGSCLTGARDLSGLDVTELYHVNTTGAAQTVILVSDSRYSFSTGPFWLIVQKLQPECMGSAITCDPSGNGQLRSCNSRGLYDYYPCNGGCMNNACVNATGEVCLDAIVLAGATGSVTGNYQGGREFNPGTGRFGGCFVDDLRAAAGGDTFYRVDLQAGQVLQATLTTNITTAHMFLFEDCSGANSCIKNLTQQGSGTLNYYASAAGSVFIVVDSSSTSTTATDTYTLSYAVTSGLACAPGSYRCVDAMTLGACSPDGSTEAQITCAAGCAGGACQSEPTARDLCADALVAPEVGSGIAVYGSFNQFTNEINLPSTSCTGQTTAGPDTFYRVTLQPGEILRARVESYGEESPNIYAFTDCADAAGTCVAGGRRLVSPGPFVAQILYANSTMMAQSLIVAADSNFSTADEPFGLFIEKLAPECQPGAVQCAADGTTLLTCNSAGLFDRYSCNGACAAGACVTPSGDACFDAIALTGVAGQVTGAFSTGTNRYSLPAGQTAGCFVDDFSLNTAADTFYRINLNAGDVLTATLNTANTNAYLFMLSGCASPNECIRNNPQRGSTTLRHYAATAQTITLVVDSYLSSVATYTLDYTVTSAQVCAQGQFRCVDATTLGICSRDGSVEAQQTCGNGCEFGACKPDVATANSCAAAAAAADVGAGIAVYANYRDLTNEINLTSTSCVGQTTAGPDMFHKVTLQPGEVLYARTESYGQEFPSVYAFTDCMNAEMSCVAGGRRVGTGPFLAQLYYLNSGMAPETLIVAADNNLSTADEPFGFFIEKLAPECQPGADICDANGIDRLVCNSAGIYERVPCAIGCSNGQCVLPPNDTCVGAITLTSGTPVSSIIDPYNSDYPLTSSACTGYTTTGRDALYKIALTQGQSVTITLTSAFDSALWISNSCDMATAAIGQCLAGVDNALSNGTETLTYVAPAAGDYYIVAQAYSSTGLGTFTITATTTP